MSNTEAPNTGHGHVRPRPDGVRVRCGGPAMCAVCQKERAALAQQPAPAAQQAEPVAWLCELMQEDGSTRTQFVEQDPAGLRWNDMGEPSPYRVTPLYATPQARQPLTEAQIVACITAAGCHGGAMRMSYGSGPYEITRPTINAVELVRAVEAAHGIKAAS